MEVIELVWSVFLAGFWIYVGSFLGGCIVGGLAGWLYATTE